MNYEDFDGVGNYLERGREILKRSHDCVVGKVRNVKSSCEL
jgi:hypothetical protein